MALPVLGEVRKLEFGKEDLLTLWRRAADRAKLEIRTRERVEGISLEANGILSLATAKGSYRALTVILATGRRGTPRKLGIPGEDLPKVMYSLLDAEAYRDKRILVVGGGDSAVEAALGLAYQRGNQVTLSYRKDVFTRLKERNAKRIRDAIRRHKVTVRFNSHPVEITPAGVILEVPGGRLEEPNDFVWIFAGGTPPNAFLETIGVRLGTQDLSDGVKAELEGVA
jgi:thioredoxin reductase